MVTPSSLVAAGADPNSADFAGNSVLMGAAFKGHLELVDELLRIGASPDLRNASGLTALDFAVTFGRTEVAEVLRAVSPRATSRWRGMFFILRDRLWRRRQS